MSFDLKITNGKLTLDPSGALNLVRDNDKLRQDIVKILITKLNENKYHPQYGSSVGSLQIGAVQDRKLLELDLNSGAESAIRYLMSMQKMQARKGQYLSPGELIIDIKNVYVTRDEADPRMYNIFISVITQSASEINEVITARII